MNRLLINKKEKELYLKFKALSECTSEGKGKAIHYLHCENGDLVATDGCRMMILHGTGLDDGNYRALITKDAILIEQIEETDIHYPRYQQVIQKNQDIIASGNIYDYTDIVSLALILNKCINPRQFKVLFPLKENWKLYHNGLNAPVTLVTIGITFIVMPLKEPTSFKPDNNLKQEN